MEWFFALVVKSLILFAYALVIGFSVVAVRKWFPTGKVKAALLSDPTDWLANLIARHIQKSRAKSSGK